MSAEPFVDTNILVYAHDLDAGERHGRARDLVAGLWRSSPLPLISVQVLQEMLVTLVRKGVAPAAARDTVLPYRRWRVVDNTAQLFETAVEEMLRWQVSFWDATIIAAARVGGAAELWSEDLSDGQDYGGLRVVNPLRVSG